VVEVQAKPQVQGLVVHAEEPGASSGGASSSSRKGTRPGGTPATGITGWRELQELRPWEGREMSSHPRSHHEM
jgi:hypothetical protein